MSAQTAYHRPKALIVTLAPGRVLATFHLPALLASAKVLPTAENTRSRLDMQKPRLLHASKFRVAAACVEEPQTVSD